MAAAGALAVALVSLLIEQLGLAGANWISHGTLPDLPQVVFILLVIAAFLPVILWIGYRVLVTRPLIVRLICPVLAVLYVLTRAGLVLAGADLFPSW